MPKQRSDDEAILVCLRTADLVRPGAASDQAECWQCNTAVWVAKSSPKTARRMCFPCAAPMLMAGGKIGPLTQKQIDDVIRARRTRWW